MLNLLTILNIKIPILCLYITMSIGRPTPSVISSNFETEATANVHAVNIMNFSIAQI